jgi:hypothetical protein
MSAQSEIHDMEYLARIVIVCTHSHTLFDISLVESTRASQHTETSEPRISEESLHIHEQYTKRNKRGEKQERHRADSPGSAKPRSWCGLLIVLKMDASKRSTPTD